MAKTGRVARLRCVEVADRCGNKQDKIELQTLAAVNADPAELTWHSAINGIQAESTYKASKPIYKIAMKTLWARP